jgi:predicted MFS family arabinose efflux permease
LAGQHKNSGREGRRRAYPSARTALPRRTAGRLFRIVWGDDVEPELRGILAVSFADTLAFSSFWSFLGIWAIEDLGASNGQLGIAFLFDAIAGLVFGYLGGHLSDRFGRKPLMLAGLGGQALVPIAFVFVDHVLPGLVLVVLTAAVAGLAIGASQAIVADLVPPERHEPAYAAVRVAFNLGVVVGPPVGGLLLWGERWSVFFLGVAALGVIAVAVAVRSIPNRGAYTPEEPPTRRSFQVIRGDRVFLIFLGSTVLAYMVYFGFETALPIAIVDSYGVSPSTWGFLIVLNAAAVAFFQLRLTRAVSAYPPGLRLAVALPLMGFSFLILTVATSLPAIVVVLVLFVIGEMLWVPTSQAIVAGMAPADVRGAYMGAFGSSSSAGFALGPLGALQLRGAAGNSAMWLFLAGTSLVAAAAGVFAVRRAETQHRPAEEPA